MTQVARRGPQSAIADPSSTPRKANSSGTAVSRTTVTVSSYSSRPPVIVAARIVEHRLRQRHHGGEQDHESHGPDGGGAVPDTRGHGGPLQPKVGGRSAGPPGDQREHGGQHRDRTRRAAPPVPAHAPG